MKKGRFTHTIREGVQDMFHIWREEFRTMSRDQGVMIFFIIVPLFYPLLYTFIYTNEVLRDVPVIVVDNSHTALSREYLRKVDATPDVRIVSYSPDMEDAKRQLKERAGYGIIQIPEDFSTRITKGEQAQVSIYSDMSGLLYYKNLLTANTAVSLEMNKEIKVEKAGAYTQHEDEVTASPIQYEDVALFNSTNGFASFLIPAVLILIIQQTLLLGVGMGVGTARERNQFKNLVPIDRHYHGTLRIVLGKGISYLMIYVVMSVYILCIVPYLFKLNQIGLPTDLMLFLLPFLIACVFFAMTCSVFIRNRETCMLIFVFTSVPLLFMSGISWPGTSIPAFWKYLSYIFPSTFGINGFVRINNMGATLNEIGVEYKALWIQAGIYFITTCLVYRHQILLSRKRVVNARKHLE